MNPNDFRQSLILPAAPPFLKLMDLTGLPGLPPYFIPSCLLLDAIGPPFHVTNPISLCPKLDLKPSNLRGASVSAVFSVNLQIGKYSPAKHQLVSIVNEHVTMLMSAFILKLLA